MRLKMSRFVSSTEPRLEREEFIAVLSLAEGRPPSVASSGRQSMRKGLLQANPWVRFPRDSVQSFQAG